LTIENVTVNVKETVQHSQSEHIRHSPKASDWPNGKVSVKESEK